MKAKPKMSNLLAVLEIEQEKRELQKLGLAAEEIDGYIEFFMDNYIEDLCGTSHVLTTMNQMS